MDITLTIFQRRRARDFEWHTVGLAGHSRTETGVNATKVQQRMLDQVRTAAAKLYPEDLKPFEHVRGRRVQVLALELNLSTEGARRRLRGKFPVVLEPCSPGPAADQPFVRVYHPLRQTEWFVHAVDRTLVEEATIFFRERWAGLTDNVLATLRSHPKDQLRIIACSATPNQLGKKLDKEAKDDRASLGAPKGEKGEALLRRLGNDQTAQAIHARLPPGMPRSPYREQLSQLVCGERKASVLLVGPAGCGKSTVVQRLVHDLLAADDYPSHRNVDKVHHVWRIRGNRLIAGMSYLGQWEQRCVDVLQTCKKHRAILWIDDVQAWGRIGVSREAERSLGTFFRGPLARGEIVFVGECTAEGYQQLLDDAPGFAGGFTTIFVEPTDAPTTMRMLLHEARALETEHAVAFDPRAFRTIFELGGALSPGLSYPGKALELLRGLALGEHGRAPNLRSAESAAAAGRKIEAIRAYREQTGAGLKDSKTAVENYMAHGRWPIIVAQQRPFARVVSQLCAQFDTTSGPAEIGPRDVIRLLARRTGMPEVLLAADRQLEVDRIEQQFRGQIMGQDAAIEAVRDLVVRIKSGLVDAGRPYGVFLFTGPTGTGKTEMAKCVAEYLYSDASRLLRFDMSEYSGPDAPSRLIGDRWRPEGTLTSKVRAQPFCVVLLDEIEKCDPSVLNLMLQLFDDGRLTDAAGTLVDFTHTVVIMTSNLGATKTPSVGFVEDERAVARDVEVAVREFFPPELFNRIDRIVQFGPLSNDAAEKIARRELTRLLDRRGLTERNIFVRFTPAVVEWVVQRGFNSRDGARSLKRFLEDRIGARLADDIAASAAAAVRVFWLHRRADALELYAQHLREAEAAAVDQGLAEVLDWNADRLRAELPAALARAEALLEGDGLDNLASTVESGLRRYHHGDDQAGDSVFNLEQLRGELRDVTEVLRTQTEYDPRLAGDDWELEGELREATDFGDVARYSASHRAVVHLRALDWRQLGPRLPLQSRPAFIDALGSLYFLEHALKAPGDADQHTVLIEFTRLTRSRGATRFSEQAPGLLEWLVDAYWHDGRGALDGAALVDLDGAVLTFDGDEVGEHLYRAYRQVVCRVVGPAVASFYAGEVGCHVRESLAGGTEIVRVRLLPGAGRTPREYLDGLRAQRDAFVHALEHGDHHGLPENPDEVLPVVRRYHYDPVRPGDPARADVEDYPLQHVMSTNVRRLGDLLPPLWFLRLGGLLEKGRL